MPALSRRSTAISIAMAAALLVPTESGLPVGGTDGSGTEADPPVPVALDVAAEAGLAQSVETWSAAVSDIDGDGWPDVFLSRHNELAPQLFLNDGFGRFVESSAGDFAVSDLHDCLAADANADERTDVFCSVGAERGLGLKSNQLWLQGPDGGFDERAWTFGVADPFGRGRRAAVIDANADGSPDLFVGTGLPRVDRFPSPSRLFLNVGGGRFRPAPAYGLDRPVGVGCAQAADVNGDGFEDLLVCEQSGAHLYRNQRGGRFVDAVRFGLPAVPVRHAGLWDVGGDHLPDLVTVLADRVEVRLQVGGRFVPSFTRRLSAGRWAAAGDVNLDGATDLYIVQGARSGVNVRDVVLLNEGSGLRFTLMRAPGTPAGVGTVAYPIDHDRNGQTDFLVLNGSQAAAPVQLIAFFPEGTVAGGAVPIPEASNEDAAAGHDRRTGSGAGTCGAAWHRVPAPEVARQMAGFQGVAARAGAGMWAVGYASRAFPKTLAVRRGAGAWTVTPTRVPAEVSGLNDVAIVAPDDVWAVGYVRARANSPPSALIQRWDGSSWSALPAPGFDRDGAVLVGAAAASPSEVWAVGYSEGEGSPRPVIRRWDGARWAASATGLPGRRRGVLADVVAPARGVAWAAGWVVGDLALRPLVQRWNGRRWSRVPAPSPGPGHAVLLGIDARAPDDAWAVGYSILGTEYRPLVERWDGADWTIVPGAGRGRGFDVLVSVAAVSPHDVSAVGVSRDPIGSRFVALVEQWDGSAWSVVEGPAFASEIDEGLSDIALSPRGIRWAVGWAEPSRAPLAMRRCDRAAPSATGAAGRSPEAVPAS